MELADVTDSKSVDGDIVWVRVPPPAPKRKSVHNSGRIFFLYYSLFNIHHSLFIKKERIFNE